MVYGLVYNEGMKQCLKSWWQSGDRLEAIYVCVFPTEIVILYAFIGVRVAALKFRYCEKATKFEKITE